MLLSLALVVSLVSISAAQRPSAHAAGQFGGSHPVQSPHTKTMQPNAAPSYCKPCLTYGGDIDPNDPNANGLADEADLIIPDATVWTPVVVKAGMTVKVTGIFGNFLNTVDNTVDPVSTPWAIRAHISDGNGGVLGPNGNFNVTVTPTGRNAFGLNEYTILGKLSRPVTLQGFTTGATYYFNIQPQCTNTSNNSCLSGQRYFLSDSEGARPNHGGLPTPDNHSFWNSSYFGYNYGPTQNACAGVGCNNFSWGLLGQVQ
jgi:hypothetical protein